MSANATLTIDTKRLNAARLAHAYSLTHCRQSADNQSCSWYHGAWQFLRLLDLVSTPEIHASHYAAQLEKIAGDNAFKNILVSGSADSGLVQTIHEALAHRQAEIKLTVVDICATPLKVCELYADDAGLEIATLEQDVLEGLPEAAFDAIFTHSFMGYFDDTARQRLLVQWARSLRPGGRLVTVQRIRENHVDDVVRFSDEEVDAFTARAAALVEQGNAGDLAELNIVDMAKKFADRFRNFPVRSAEQLQRMFEAAGFKLAMFERQATQGIEGITGPSVPNAAGFYLIAAERV